MAYSINSTSQNDLLIMLGDFNSRVAIAALELKKSQ